MNKLIVVVALMVTMFNDVHAGSEGASLRPNSEKFLSDKSEESLTYIDVITYGNQLVMAGSSGEALRVYERALKQNVCLNDAELLGLYVQIATLKRELGCFDEAEKYYAKTVDLLGKSSDLPVHLKEALGSIYAEYAGFLDSHRNNPERGRYYFEIAADLIQQKVYRTQGLIHHERGIYLARSGKYDEAMSEYKIAIDAYQNIGDEAELLEIYNCVAYLFFRKEDSEQALVYLNKLLPIMKKLGSKVEDPASILDTSACIYALNENYEEAEKYQRLAIKSLEKDSNPSLITVASFHEKLGDVLSKLGKKSEAFEMWERALEYYEKSGLPDVKSEVILKIETNNMQGA